MLILSICNSLPFYQGLYDDFGRWGAVAIAGLGGLAVGNGIVQPFINHGTRKELEKQKEQIKELEIKNKVNENVIYGQNNASTSTSTTSKPVV